MPGASNGIAPSRAATSPTFSLGTNRNSAFGSTNFAISHGHAMRSTFAFSRVTHFNETTSGLQRASPGKHLRSSEGRAGKEDIRRPPCVAHHGQRDRGNEGEGPAPAPVDAPSELLPLSDDLPRHPRAVRPDFPGHRPV